MNNLKPLTNSLDIKSQLYRTTGATSKKNSKTCIFMIFFFPSTIEEKDSTLHSAWNM